jgi:hypothetical protein
LNRGPVLLYRAETANTFGFTGVGVQPGDQPIAPEGYVLLPEEPRVLWGEAAEREAALHRLTPLGPFVLDVSWDELPQAFMATEEEHWGWLGSTRWVQRGEPQGLGDQLLGRNDVWVCALAVEPAENEERPGQLRTRLDGWVTVLCLFARISAELEGLLKAGLRVRKLLVLEIGPVARRILEYRVRALYHSYPNQLPAVACKGLLTALPADIRDVGPRELMRYMPLPAGDCVIAMPRPHPRQPLQPRAGGSTVRAD